jgi:hypothetical protein
MDNTYEMYKAGLLTTLTVKDLEVGDLVELKLHRILVDEISGKEIINSSYKMYYTPDELKSFLHPFINDMKARFENANSVQE